MKIPLVAIGFLCTAILSFVLMQMPQKFFKGPAGWQEGSIHMVNVSRQTQPMLDKCKLDRLQGRLKNREESVKCSNPALKDAFKNEGFPKMEQVDAFLEKKLEFARKFDAQQISEDELNNAINKAFSELLAGQQ